MTLLQGFQTALNFVYPARCLTCGAMVDSDFGLCGPCWRDTAFVGGTACDGCGVPLPGVNGGHSLQCDTCLAAPRLWIQGRAALVYRDTGRKLVLALKHGDRQEIARPASLWMANVVQSITPENALIAPVPLHWLRLMKRRYNQSALLAKALSARMGCAWCPDLLQRYRRTSSLDGLGGQERHDMLQNAIRVHPNRRHRLMGRPILLVDDVMTSGATLTAATKACLEAGSGPVRVVTLARVAKDT
tara:strand:+ start:3105 stop:3839 length:735 start_codon:yes stop_codon:yes gene_type:complete